MKYLFVVTVLALFSAGVYAEKSLPEVSHDGLHLQKGTKLRMVYKADGADLSQYTKVALLEAYVAFKKNWQRDHNRDVMSLEERISDKDMKKIRNSVTNTADADRVMRRWAKLLNDHLAHIKG